jgi:hypothetical protein
MIDRYIRKENRKKYPKNNLSKTQPSENTKTTKTHNAVKRRT